MGTDRINSQVEVTLAKIFPSLKFFSFLLILQTKDNKKDLASSAIFLLLFNLFKSIGTHVLEAQSYQNTDLLNLSYWGFIIKNILLKYEILTL